MGGYPPHPEPLLTHPIPSGFWSTPDSSRADYPDHLGTRFDWMSVPHRAMFRMVHDGMNPQAGMSVSDDWAHLGTELAVLCEELTMLRERTAAMWQGEAAGFATENIAALATWARETSDTATEMSDWVERAVENAARARNAMPQPVDAGLDGADGASPMPHGPEIAPPSPGGSRPLLHADIIDTVGTTSAAGAGGGPGGALRAFTGHTFASAPDLVVDHQVETFGAARDRHVQAAHVMNQFQDESRTVHQSVPRFSGTRPASLGGGRRNGDIDGPRSVRTRVTSAADIAGGGRVSSGIGSTAGTAGTAGVGAPASGGGTGGAGDPAVGGGNQGGGHRPRAAPGARFGAGTSAVPTAGGAGGAGGAVSRAMSRRTPASAAGGGGFGAMPMTGAPGAGRDEDREHKNRGYIEGDIWTYLGNGLTVSVPVIGEERSRA